MTKRADLPAQGKPAGIKEIARTLGVSIGTVDRALHGRPGINPLTRSRVLKMAQTLGYRPNVAARHLRLNRRLRVSVHLPAQIALFFDALRDGLDEAARPFQSTIDVQFRSYARLGEGDAELFAEALEEGTSGIILVPGHPTDLKPWIRKAARAHIPVVCVATDAPGTERLASVAVDAPTSGSLAAELLSSFIPDPKPVLVMTGDLSTVDHAEKVQGFESFLKMTRSPVSVAAILEAHDDASEAYRLTKESLEQHTEVGSIYVSTANSMPVIQALKDAGRLNRVHVVTTDLFPEMGPLIRDGAILATIYQRPKAQGRMAFQALHQFLVQGTCPPARQRLHPHLILRSNLDVFLKMLPADSEAQTARYDTAKRTSRARPKRDDRA
jgi:LacI family transcriptional regulator